jgi:hypothetical protein
MIDGFVYTDANGPTLGRRNIPPAWIRPQDFAGGHAYYLGDYTAKGAVESERKILYTQLHWSWEMEPDGDEYEDATGELQRRFPGLAALPTEDRTLIVKQPRPASTRAALRPGEAPLSPERARVLAPFIKRTFATPAECDAACPTGECLPFRGDDGPAMTCIVRCQADNDCPAGLDCNCPNSDSPGCHPIAGTPSDPMHGFCLSVEPSGPRR